MKQLLVLIVILFAGETQALDSNIISYKDWRADIVSQHKVTEKAACVAQTKARRSNTSLEIFAEANEQGGYVEPVVQIITTDVPPALAVLFKTGGQRFPMSISLKETREVEIDVIPTGSFQPVKKKVEQQVFIGKFNSREDMIQLIRAKLSVDAQFINASGVVAQEKFSLRGSSHTVKTMMQTCL